MASINDLTEEQQNAVLDTFEAKIKGILESSETGKDALKGLETQASNDTLKNSPDGADPTAEVEGAPVSSEEVDAVPVNPDKNDGTPKTKEEVSDEKTARAIVKKNKEENKGYFENSEDSKPLTQKDIDSIFGSAVKATQDALAKAYHTDDSIPIEWGTQKETEAMRDAKKRAAQSDKTNWASDEVNFKDGEYTINGEKRKFKKATQRVDWGEIIQKEAHSQEEAIERLRQFISYNIKKLYGGFSRIKTIAVRSQQLIINDVCYMPALEKSSVNSKVFPLDTIEYIENGLFAPLFDWKHLKEMTNVSIIDIDDPNFYATCIANDIGVGRRIGVSSLFNLCPSLEYLVIGGEVVSRDGLNKEESVPIKKKVGTAKHWQNFKDGFNIDIRSGLDRAWEMSSDNFLNYVANRGDKGLARYLTGFGFTLGVAAVSGVLKFAAGLVGGIANVIRGSKSDEDA